MVLVLLESQMVPFDLIFPSTGSTSGLKSYSTAHLAWRADEVLEQCAKADVDKGYACTCSAELHETVLQHVISLAD